MPPTKARFIRVSDELWDKAMARAQRENTNLSELIRGWLDDYASETTSLTDELARIVARLRDILKRLDQGGTR